MSEKTKVNIVYIITFTLILSNAHIFNGSSLIEMILRAFDITTFYSQGDTAGFYYPTIAVLFIGLMLWIYLRKSVPKSKFSRDYFYYCLSMMLIISLVNHWIHSISI